MFHNCGIKNLSSSHINDVRGWKLVTDKKLSFLKVRNFTEVSGSSLAVVKASSYCSKINNKYKIMNLVPPIRHDEFSVKIGNVKNNYEMLARYFSKSSNNWNNQSDEEKRKNYLLFSVVGVAVLFYIYMYLTMEHHQDYIYVEPDDKK